MLSLAKLGCAMCRAPARLPPFLPSTVTQPPGQEVNPWQDGQEIIKQLVCHGPCWLGRSQTLWCGHRGHHQHQVRLEERGIRQG